MENKNPQLCPLVSICIATFNRKELLFSTVESILAQTYENLEIIIVDDHSTDGTEEYVHNDILNLDKRILYLKHDKNKGLAAARNTAIFSSAGKFFTFCDDDDRWEPKFVEEFVRVANRYTPDWSFCCGGRYTNAVGTLVNMTNDVEYDLKQYIKLGFTPPVASQFYFLESLKRVGGYNESIKSGVDHDLWFRLAKRNTKIKSIPIPLSIQNSGVDIGRITTDYNKRVNGITESLAIWKEDLIFMYGDDFYQKYSSAYIEREKLFMLNLYFTEFKISEAVKMIGGLSFYKVMSIATKASIKWITRAWVPSVLLPQEKNITIAASIILSNDEF